MKREGASSAIYVALRTRRLSRWLHPRSTTRARHRVPRDASPFTTHAPITLAGGAVDQRDVELHFAFTKNRTVPKAAFRQSKDLHHEGSDRRALSRCNALRRYLSENVRRK